MKTPAGILTTIALATTINTATAQTPAPPDTFPDNTIQVDTAQADTASTIPSVVFTAGSEIMPSNPNLVLQGFISPSVYLRIDKTKGFLNGALRPYVVFYSMPFLNKNTFSLSCLEGSIPLGPQSHLGLDLKGITPLYPKLGKTAPFGEISFSHINPAGNSSLRIEAGGWFDPDSTTAQFKNRYWGAIEMNGQTGKLSTSMNIRIISDKTYDQIQSRMLKVMAQLQLKFDVTKNWSIYGIGQANSYPNHHLTGSIGTYYTFGAGKQKQK